MPDALLALLMIAQAENNKPATPAQVQPRIIYVQPPEPPLFQIPNGPNASQCVNGQCYRVPVAPQRPPARQPIRIIR